MYTGNVRTVCVSIIGCRQTVPETADPILVDLFAGQRATIKVPS